MTGENLEAVYGIRAMVRIADDCPFVIPIGRIAQKEN